MQVAVSFNISRMPQDSLQIDDQPGSQPGQRVLRLSGALVISTFFSFQSIVRSDTSRLLVIDFTNVPYVDSAGIGALVGAYVTRQHSARSLALAGVSERIHVLDGGRTVAEGTPHEIQNNPVVISAYLGMEA